MKWYTALLYSFGSGFILMIALMIATAIFNLIRGTNRQERGNLLYLTIVRIVGIIIFLLWTAIVYELTKHINGGSKFIKNLIVFIPFFMFASGYARENVSMARKVQAGHYEHEISTVLMNGSGYAVFAFILFYFKQNFNNKFFFDIPSTIMNWLL